MLASELIEKLQDHIKSNGDAQVLTEECKLIEYVAYNMINSADIKERFYILL